RSLVLEGEPEPAVLHGEADAGEPTVEERALQCTLALHLGELLLLARTGTQHDLAAGLAWDVVLEEGPRSGAERLDALQFGHRTFHSGSRFSRKAFAPSCASSVTAT